MSDQGQESSVERIERFIELARLDEEELRAQHSGEVVEWLSMFVSEELVDVALPAFDSPDQFVDAVRRLSENKRAWSQRLGSLVIDLIDSEGPEQEAAALKRLKEFAEQSPWKFLRKSAENKLGS